MEEYYESYEESWSMGRLILGIALVFLFLFPTAADNEAFELSGSQTIIQDTDYQFIEFTEQEIYAECSNLHIINTVECMKKFIDGIYIYRITPNGEEVKSFEELKYYGGDCLDWSDWMTGVYSKLGFEAGTKKIPLAQTEIIQGYNVTHHEFNWVKRGDIYCVYAGINNPVCGKLHDEYEFDNILYMIKDTKDLADIYYRNETRII